MEPGRNAEPIDTGITFWNSARVVIPAKVTSLTFLRYISRKTNFPFQISRGAQELSKVIEDVSLSYTISPFPSSVCNVFELDSVVEAVLSSSTVTSLKTNFPFQISSRTKINEIGRIIIDIQRCAHPLEIWRCLACLRSLAYFSRVKLSITIRQLSALTNCMTILNNSLHSTIRIFDNIIFYWKIGLFNVISHSSSYRSSLSYALKRDVSVPLSSLRRSQSLNDLSISNHPCEYYQSCPDLLEMQSLLCITTWWSDWMEEPSPTIRTRLSSF